MSSALLLRRNCPGHAHLYVMRNAPFMPEGDGVNGRLLIVESSPAGTRLLGEGAGWGVATRLMPREIYPVLVFIAHMSAEDSELEVHEFEGGKYIRKFCGDTTAVGKCRR